MTGWRPKAAMVLAAGRGVRMRPLTIDRPKPLVHYKGRALLDHVLDRIVASGIGTAVVNMHYFGEQIEAYAAARKGGPTIILSDERDALLDTGGGVKRALPLLGDDAFLIHNSDSVWVENDCDNLKALFARWDAEVMDCLMLVTSARASLGYNGPGDFEMSASGELVRPSGSGGERFVFTGVSIAHPRLFREAPDGVFSLNRVWDRAIGEGRLHGHLLRGTWMHLGTPEALETAENWCGDV